MQLYEQNIVIEFIIFNFCNLTLIYVITRNQMFKISS